MTLKRLWGVNLTPSIGFFKNLSSRERMKPWLFVAFKIVISHIFPENFIEILQDVQNIWRFYPSTLFIFIHFSDFLTFPCYKETDDVCIYLTISAYFYFQPTPKRLVNNCIKFYGYKISSS